MTTTKYQALMLGEFDYSKENLSWLADAGFEVLTSAATSRQEFIDELNSGKYDGVLTILRTFESGVLTGPFDEELIRLLPPNIKFINHSGAGYDQIDVPSCTERGIRVSNAVGAMDHSTAICAMCLIVMVFRDFQSGITSIERGGDWRALTSRSRGEDPAGKVVGIVGMGSIGQELCKLLKMLGVNVIYHNRNRLPEDKENGATYVDFDTLLRDSDCVSINLPLNSNTKHMFQKKQFEMMKKTASIVNTARGSIIKERDLIDAIKTGQIAGAGLDVYEHEPEINKWMINNPKVTTLPHMGGWTKGAGTEMENQTIKNALSVLTTGKLVNIVPEQAHLGLGA